jgi:hypothetical protein
MPNWVRNNVVLTHKETAKIKEIVKAVQEERLFDSLIPLPNGQWDYDWAWENWGTKWDACNAEIVEEIDAHCVALNFDTAWDIPKPIFHKLVELGFEVDVEFVEEGLDFFGGFNNASGLRVGRYTDLENKTNKQIEKRLLALGIPEGVIWEVVGSFEEMSEV